MPSQLHLVKQLIGTVWPALALLVLAACSSPLAKPAYLAYLTDPKHGLTHTQEVNGATISCSYRPPDLLLSQELAVRPATTPVVLDSLRRMYASKTYCTLTLSQGGAEIESPLIQNSDAYSQALAYLNTGITQDVILTSNAVPTDSVTALAATYPRQYGATGFSTVLLVFDTHALDLNNGFRVTFRGDKFNLGAVRFAFSGRDLDALPRLQL